MHTPSTHSPSLPALLACVLALLCLMHTPAAGASPPDLYVLAIGVSQYDDDTIPPLAYADDDARALVRWAEGQRGKVYGQVHTRLLVEKDATRRQIIAALVEFLRPAAPSDQILLFLGGHGVVEPDTGAYHFLTYDTALDSIAGTALEQDDILKKLETGQRRRDRVVVLIDTCQAGALADRLPREGRGMFVAADAKLLKDEQVLDRESVWVIFTAGTAKDKATEGPEFRLPDEDPIIKGHGLFTWAVLRALGSTAADLSQNGIVSLSEFQAFVSSVVRAESNGKQIPVLSGKQTDIALAFAQGTQERCDGQDNNLNGIVDEGFRDENRNGVADCLDQEICNGIDDNADGRIDEGFDRDGDMHLSIALCGSRVGDDCDDADISIHPNQKDWGNLRDDDCDGLYDEEDVRVNDLPRSLYRRAQGLWTVRNVALGVGTTLALTGVGFYASLASLLPPADAVTVPQEDEAQYLLHSRIAIACASAGAIGLGIGGTFHLQHQRFTVEFFPKDRRYRPSQDALEGAGASAQFLSTPEQPDSDE